MRGLWYNLGVIEIAVLWWHFTFGGELCDFDDIGVIRYETVQNFEV